MSLFFKRCFDVFFALLLLLLLLPLMAVIAVAVRLTSKGRALFCQTRITTLGREFTIFKFRTMTQGAVGSGVTTQSDSRITPLGMFLRRTRLDELPQLFNILKGEMSFVGTRPELPCFVAHYTEEMRATLLLPAGLTSVASICFAEEGALLEGEDADIAYLVKVLPVKMRYNLEYLKRFGFWEDVKVLTVTLLYILRKRQSA